MIPASRSGGALARWLPWLALVLIPAVLALPYLYLPLGRDQSNWLLFAMNLREGRVLYRDVSFVNTPGLAVALWLPLTLFGHLPELAVYLVHVFATSATCLGLGLLVLACGGSRRQGLAAGLATACLWPQYFTFWEVAQKDLLALPFVVMACWAAARAMHDPARAVRWWAGSGAAVGFAVQVKTPFGVAGIVLFACTCLVLFARRAQARAPAWERALVAGGAMFAGLLVSVAPLGLYLVAHGAAQDMWASTVQRASAYGGAYRRGGLDLVIELLRPTHWPALGLLLALFAIPPDLRARRDQVWQLALLLIVVAVYALQGRGWVYHTMPVAAVLIALGFANAVRTFEVQSARGHRRRLWAPVLAAIAALLILREQLPRQILAWMNMVTPVPAALHAHTGQMLDPQTSRRVAQLMQRRTQPDETIFVWGMESQIYVYANRLNAGVSCCDAPIYHPQLAEAQPEYFDRQLSRFKRVLHDHPPAYFLVVMDDRNPVEPTPSDQSLMAAPGLPALIRNMYEPEQRIGKVVILRRRQRGSDGDAARAQSTPASAPRL